MFEPTENDSRNQHEFEVCQYCGSWTTNPGYMKKYGEGSGYCQTFGEVRFCSRQVCLAYYPDLSGVKERCGNGD